MTGTSSISKTKHGNQKTETKTVNFDFGKISQSIYIYFDCTHLKKLLAEHDDFDKNKSPEVANIKELQFNYFNSENISSNTKVLSFYNDNTLELFQELLNKEAKLILTSKLYQTIRVIKINKKLLNFEILLMTQNNKRSKQRNSVPIFDLIFRSGVPDRVFKKSFLVLNEISIVVRKLGQMNFLETRKFYKSFKYLPLLKDFKIVLPERRALCDKVMIKGEVEPTMKSNLLMLYGIEGHGKKLSMLIAIEKKSNNMERFLINETEKSNSKLDIVLLDKYGYKRVSSWAAEYAQK